MSVLTASDDGSATRLRAYATAMVSIERYSAGIFVLMDGVITPFT
jgi:hypothetical protein